MNGPDLTPIDPFEVLCFEQEFAGAVVNELYYAYHDLYAFWAESEDDHTLTEKIDEPKMSSDPTLCMNDFTSLANSLAIYGYIG